MKGMRFQRDYWMLVCGQVFSLFGNAILRYALPIYLLNELRSSALFGAVSACSFLPMIVFAPIGGIAADRVNRRNVMVLLDFCTAAGIAVLMLLRGKISPVALTVSALMLLYSIQGAYQPAAQSSIPALARENLNAANAIVNIVSSLSGILGPAIGGIVFAAFGLTPILQIGAVCFLCAAAIEMGMRAPFPKRKREIGCFALAKRDIQESFWFICREKPAILRVSLVVVAVNLIFSSLIAIGTPVIVTVTLGFGAEEGNRLYGFLQGALAIGGLLGGVCASARGKRMAVQSAWKRLLGCTLVLIPFCAAVLIKGAPMVSYALLAASCVGMMICATIFNIQILTYIGSITPGDRIAKVLALFTCFCQCANPVGQVIYGFLFEKFADMPYGILAGAFLVSAAAMVWGRKTIKSIPRAEESAARTRAQSLSAKPPRGTADPSGSIGSA